MGKRGREAKRKGEEGGEGKGERKGREEEGRGGKGGKGRGQPPNILA